MKTLFKKNQLMISALAIMLAIAGYLQFAGRNLEEEYLEAGEMLENQTTDVFTEMESLDTDGNLYVEDYLGDDITITDVALVEPTEGEIPGEAVFTSTSGVTILAEARLLKDRKSVV